jgi:hypothetical protein
MFDYLTDAGELVATREPYPGAGVPQYLDGIQQDDFSNWRNYALFVIEQQESYCQLV